MAAHTPTDVTIIQPVQLDQPQTGWAPWLREIAGAVNQLGVKTTELAAAPPGSGPAGPPGPTGPTGPTGPAGPSGTSGPWTVGAIPFANTTSSLGQDPTQLYWDDAGNRLGINTNAPAAPLDVRGNLECTGIVYSKGTTAAFDFEDRAAPGTQWIWYATGGSARLFRGGDIYAIDSAGNVAVSGGQVIGSPAGGNKGVGSLNATALYVNNAAVLTGNQTVTLSGVVTGSGATAITTTLATVNANVGTFQGLTVNAKGLVTAAADQAYATSAAMTTADNLRVLKAGDTMTGALTIQSNTQFTGISIRNTTNAIIGLSGQGTGNEAGALSLANAGTTTVVLRSSGDSYVNGGNFGVGITTPTSAKLMVVGSATAGLTDVQVAGGPNASDTTTKMVQFYDAAFNTVQGAITRNGSNAVAYGTASDGRLKDGVTDSEVGLDALLALKVRDYVFEGDARVQQGLLAQEVADVYPVAVHEGGDDPAKDPWMIDYGRLTPLLIRAIQQQQAEIERLKRRLDRR